MSVKLVEVTRSELVESTHQGSVAVVNSEGQVVCQLGDVQKVCFFRSASKPFQTIALLGTGISERYNLDLKDISLMISSHSGEKEHIIALMDFMKKTGMNAGQLQCGIHEPVSKEAAQELLVSGGVPSQLHCNCSGKHVGVLAAAKAMGVEEEGYYTFHHPVQKKIDQVISAFSEFPIQNTIKGVDGCGMPVHAVPLENIARSYANLSNSSFLEGQYAQLQSDIIRSMATYPRMVAGNGRLDTIIMEQFGDRVIAKVGTEGVYCMSILEKSIGVAIKIEDGSSRALGPVALEILLQLNVISREEADQAKEFWRPQIFNHRKEQIGEVRAVFKLK